MGHIHGKPRQIRIGCQRRMTEAEFYVTDTGTGIEPEDVGRIFHVFRRGRNRLAPGVAGKGVGLASVKSIVETYGGTIWVESKPGQGSTFRFTVSGIYVLDLPSQAFTSMPPVPSMPAEQAAGGVGRAAGTLRPWLAAKPYRTSFGGRNIRPSEPELWIVCGCLLSRMTRTSAS
jgi:hypothetical protein